MGWVLFKPAVFLLGDGVHLRRRSDILCVFVCFPCFSDSEGWFFFRGEHTHKQLRRLAAEYMRNNETHFRDFLSLGRETFEAYCTRIEKVRHAFYQPAPCRFGIMPRPCPSRWRLFDPVFSSEVLTQACLRARARRQTRGGGSTRSSHCATCYRGTSRCSGTT